MNTSIRKFNGRVDTQNNPYGIGIQTNSLFGIFIFIPRVQNKVETENDNKKQEAASKDIVMQVIVCIGIDMPTICTIFTTQFNRL